MTLFSRLRIRTKLALIATLLLAVVSVAVYIYFPARGKEQALAAVSKKAAAISEMAALSAARGLVTRDRVDVSEVLSSLRHSTDLAYFILLDDHGRVFASFNDRVATETAYEKLLKNADALQAGRKTTDVTPSTAETEPGPVPGVISQDGSIYSVVTPVRFRGRNVGKLVTGFSLQQVQQDAARSRATVALVTLIAFAIGTLAVFGLSTLITEPLKRIVRAAASIAGGALSTRVDVVGSDEVGHLAKAFNLMLDRLGATQNDLETLNRTLEQRVEHRAQQLMTEIEKRRRAQERYQLLVDQNLASIYVATTDGRILTCNDACARLFGYESGEQLLDQEAMVDYMNPRDRDSIMRRLRSDGNILNEEVELRARGGESVWALENIRLIPGDEVTAPRLEGMLLDITDRKRAEDEIAYKAYHDSLTGLPNRALFLDRLAIARAQATRKHRQLVVIFLDLDDLKTINDTLGHAMGDALLKLFATRLQDTLREGDTVARVGGDEFVILLPDAESAEAAEKVTGKILRASREPFQIEDEELYVTASIGVALFPEDGLASDELLRAADGAMYRVKEAGGNHYEFCNRTGNRAHGRLSLESELREAIERDEFLVRFQPQVKIVGRELVGVEALVRWEHPQRGLVEPAGFITVAEQTGLIAAIGEIVLRKACQQGVAWIRSGYQCPRISVNVSPRQFYQRDFIGTIERILEETALDPSFLELEITESVAMQKSERSIGLLRQLRERGTTIAIDDFGTGQSSLSYLKDFQVDTVKIDKSFVRDIVTQANDQSIVTAVLVLANELGLRTIAEGVETEEQCAFLRDHGCAEMQGYLISRPVPAVELQRFLLKTTGQRLKALLPGRSKARRRQNAE
jgi:diguanylate cyclase (GGDEF)-like protein/PAS domain S-box-containing protein